MTDLDLNITTQIDRFSSEPLVNSSLSEVDDKSSTSQDTSFFYVSKEYLDFRARDFNTISILLSSVVIKTFQIAGVNFLLEFENGMYHLTHPVWSLSGSGHTLIEAEMNLRREASDIFDFYNESSLFSLSNDALKFRDYLMSITGRYARSER